MPGGSDLSDQSAAMTELWAFVHAEHCPQKMGANMDADLNGVQNIGGVTVKFKSGGTAIWIKFKSHLIIGSRSGYFYDRKIRSDMVPFSAPSSAL